MSNAALTFTTKVSFKTGSKGAKVLTAADTPAVAAPAGRVPRVSRLMALAIKLEGLLAAGEVTDHAELAQVGHITRARITQIMNLTLLAPDIQEAVLFLPLTLSGRHPITEEMLRPIAAETRWETQRRMWAALCEV